MPHGEQRRIAQILTEKTKRTALKECQVPGNHEGKIVEGHSIQEAIIRELTPNYEVFTFNDIPLVIDRFRKFPRKVSFRHALTGHFTCEEHEKLFFDVERRQPDFAKERHLDLLAYKALIRVLWETKLLKGALEFRSISGRQKRYARLPAKGLHRDGNRTWQHEAGR